MSKLYIVPTPIGNLEDMTLRAIRILKEVDLVFAEDTRTSGFLMKHFEIGTQLRSYHLHNEHKIVENLVEQIKNCANGMALISDAGTPAISDPGFLLVRACIAQGVEVETLPGATAFVPALVSSGLPCDSFLFEGFLPHKKGRQKRLLELAELNRTIIFYESPYRIVKLLEEFTVHFGGERRCSIARELSKKFEEIKRGTVTELLEHFTKTTPKGEFVVVVEGKVN
jgi:16S rRNA (cytidine1402-2'-O)-methyltransferase